MVPTQRVPAVARAATILRHLALVGHPLTGTALASALGLPRSSVIGICDALAEERLLVRLGDGSLWLGPHVLELASAATTTMDRPLGVGFLMISRQNSFSTAMLDAATREIGGDEGRLLVRDAREDPARQHEQWRELIEEGADVLIVDSVSAQAPPDGLALARQAGVPVVAVGSRLDGADAGVTSDNTQAGLLAGRFLADLCGGRGRVAILDGLNKNANVDRVAGLHEALREVPGMEIVAHERLGHDTPAAGERGMRNLSTDETDVDAVFAVCDPIALGAARAQDELGRRIPIVGVDARSEVVETILDGGPILASIAQDPARLIVTAIRAAKELALGRVSMPRALLVPVRLIDGTNAGEFPSWG